MDPSLPLRLKVLEILSAEGLRLIGEDEPPTEEEALSCASRIRRRIQVLQQAERRGYRGYRIKSQ